ncbi:MAG: exonuclease domain-containing protein [Alphaproteobacteria bacterium]|nr:exonuclease domain-containing protein [Alphaproteobacteria bacterium]
MDKVSGGQNATEWEWPDNHYDPFAADLPNAGIMCVFDVEYTAWEGSHARRWSEPWEHREIIHMGAVAVDAGSGFRELAAFEVYVRPTLNPTLSDYICSLTGIDDAKLDAEGVSFPEAWQRFCEFVGPTMPIYANGTDAMVLRDNCWLNNISYTIHLTRTHNLRRILAQAIGIDSAQAISSHLPDLLGLKSMPECHTGLWDARAIVAGLSELRKRGAIS